MSMAPFQTGWMGTLPPRIAVLTMNDQASTSLRKLLHAPRAGAARGVAPSGLADPPPHASRRCPRLFRTKIAASKGARFSVVCLLATLTVGRARADTSGLPVLEQVDVIEALGKKVPLDLSFLGTTGVPVRLSDVVSGQRPVMLTLVYFRCPMLCGLELGGIVRSLKMLHVRPGADVDLLTVSFDPDDRPAEGAQQRKRYLDSLGIADREPVWPFLTGDERAINVLTKSLGFQYVRVPHSADFAHAAVSFVLTPDGTISRYLYGVDFPERDLRLALAEASGGGWGRSFDRFLLHCFRYDPATRRYGFYISTYFRGCSALVLLGVLLLIFRPFGFLRRTNKSS